MKILSFKYKFIISLFQQKAYYFFKNQSGKALKQQNFKFGKRRVYLIHDAEMIRSAFKVGKRLHREPLKKIIGNGLFSEETSLESRKRRRKIQEKIKSDTFKYINDCISKNYQNLELNGLQEKSIITRLQFLSIETNIDIVLSPDTDAEKKELCGAVSTVLGYIEYELFSRVKVGWKRKKQFTDAKEYISKYVGRSILQPELVSKHSLLGCLLLLYKENELDEQQVIDEVFSFLGSGVETTGIMLVWITKCYLDYPKQAEALRAELIEKKLDYQTVLSNKKFSNYILEVLRHYPAAWAMIRYIEDDQISGIKAKSFVWLSPCVTHFDPRYWEQPEVFNPDRFDYPYNKNAYFPFSQGTHKCFGEYLAMNQMKAFAYHCTRKLDIKNSNLCVRGYSSKLALAPRGIIGKLSEKHGT